MKDPSTGATSNLLRMRGAGVGVYHALIDEKLTKIPHRCDSSLGLSRLWAGFFNENVKQIYVNDEQIQDDRSVFLFQEAAKLRIGLLEMIKDQPHDSRYKQTILSTVNKLEMDEKFAKGPPFDSVRLAKLETRVYRLNLIKVSFDMDQKVIIVANAIKDGDKGDTISDHVEDEEGGNPVSGKDGTKSKKEKAESEEVRVVDEDVSGITQNKDDIGKSDVENENESSDDSEDSAIEESFSDQEDRVTKTEVCTNKATASSKDVRIKSSDSIMSSPGNCSINVDVERISSSASMDFQIVATGAKSNHTLRVFNGNPEPIPCVKVDEAEAEYAAGVNAVDAHKLGNPIVDDVSYNCVHHGPGVIWSKPEGETAHAHKVLYGKPQPVTA
ncbi:hypothetical protein U1Q18_014452 [Sarracenia purpurea var. burkii]